MLHSQRLVRESMKDWHSEGTEPPEDSQSSDLASKRFPSLVLHEALYDQEEIRRMC